MAKQRQFTTKFEAERRIAELGKAGILKPVHLPGRQWLLTDNREGTISRSQLYHMLAVHYEKKGMQVDGHFLNEQANQIFAQAAEGAAQRKN